MLFVLILVVLIVDCVELCVLCSGFGRWFVCGFVNGCLGLLYMFYMLGVNFICVWLSGVRLFFFVWLLKLILK